MSEEELNEELSNDELKDVSGGFARYTLSMHEVGKCPLGRTEAQKYDIKNKLKKNSCTSEGDRSLEDINFS